MEGWEKPNAFSLVSSLDVINGFLYQVLHMDRPERNRSWAPGIEPITIGQLDPIGVDSEGNLYWDGGRLKIERRLKLSRLQSVSAFIVLISTFVGGVGAGFQGWGAICQTNPK